MNEVLHVLDVAVFELGIHVREHDFFVFLELLDQNINFAVFIAEFEVLFDGGVQSALALEDLDEFQVVLFTIKARFDGSCAQIRLGLVLVLFFVQFDDSFLFLEKIIEFFDALFAIVGLFFYFLHQNLQIVVLR